MLLPRSVALVSAIFLQSSITSAVSFNCKDVVADKQHWNFGALGGPKAVHWIQDEGRTVSNFTFTLDICNNLKKLKNIPKNDQCPSIGTRICGIEEEYFKDNNNHGVKKVVPIAGNFETTSGGSIDPKITRLKTSSSSADTKKEGVRVELHGGKWVDPSKHTIKQKAIIEFLCDPDRTGLEEAEEDKRPTEPSDDDDSSDTEKAKRRAENSEDDEDGSDNKKASLRFLSYKTQGEGKDETGVLRLEWLTKHACEKREDGNDAGGPSDHWGFFTWFIIILFLAIASYLIFGSWLNYNRYGARGWDLLPHGDTIRDIPYILKDWGRGVANSLQGHGSRGGYSAV
ncbi:hypothetical protein M501DRAFT_994786 [Patellaria atrata CBS 101060]|uniref:Autophagy-related protein 27 n=1 Tax=Patellaria atrata CBS 101060 TaxID=1346257 RepID=A0A9P4SL02_9PEZI|nr:hypothetical protein M501DRAFT_994786 [Patellaria atrata CBS 101060]